MRYLFSTILCLLAITCFTQTNISGIINKYAAVTAIDFCNNNVTVSNTVGFFAGQRVLIIQMKGAEISGSNNSSFGDITNYKSCGNYEIAEIKSITGSVIEFKYALTRDYEATGSVQLVSLEEYTDAVVSAPLACAAWNGSTGGIVLLKANTLTLNDSITVKGKGFRGAVYENDNAGQACYNNTGGATSYYCTTVNCGAPKGEGIGVAGGNYGRGKNGSGGGGGNDHNTGGGGGSNYGKGGDGGRRSNESSSQCHGPAPGVGGTALAYSTSYNKIFMGGGGGAGDGNNNQGTGGANGGGIAIIMCNTLVGNNKKINANGNSVDSVVGLNCCYAQSDGAGGGGGGGTVLLYADNYSGTVRVDAVGGTGGHLDNGGSTGTNAFCMGPGGGGGGGVLWVKGNSISANVVLTDTGGTNGNNRFGLGPAGCPFGTTNGAQPGDAGGSLTGLDILFDSIPFVKLVANACCDTTVCPSSTVLMNVTDTATLPPTILWNTGATSNSITEQVFSTTPFTVTVTDVLHSICSVTQTVTATVQNALPNVSVCCDTNVCTGAYASFSVSATGTGQYTYQWSSGETTTAITQQILGSQAFYVTVTDENGCSVEKFTVVLTNNTSPTLTVCCDTIVCAGNTVSMSAASSSNVSYLWSTGQTTSSITQPVPSSTNFVVTVTDVNGCIATNSANAFVTNAQISVTANPDTAILPGQTVQLTAVGDSAYAYLWSPNDRLDNSTIYNPIATPGATTTYCVTATGDYSCTTSDCYTIEVIQNEVIIKVPDAFSPNGDNKNDAFTVFPIGNAEVFDIKIYNRWGEVVFTSKGNNSWDGNYQGKPQPAGSYVCNISYGNPLSAVKPSRLVKDFVLIR